MTQPAEFDDLERDLSAFADGLALPAVDTHRTLRRMAWEERRPTIYLACTLALMGATLALQMWLVAAALGLFFLPERVSEFRARRTDGAALLATSIDESFLERERSHVSKRLRSARSSVLLLALLALALALTAPLGNPSTLAARWAIAGAAAAFAVGRGLFVARPLARELADLGGDDTAGWAVAMVFGLLIAAAPFLVLGGMLYRGARRLIGRPVPDPDTDSPTDSKADR